MTRRTAIIGAHPGELVSMRATNSVGSPLPQEGREQTDFAALFCIQLTAGAAA
jgi:hypothetical protein